MPYSADIIAGRAAVELVLDKSQIAPGMDAAAREIRSGKPISDSQLDAAVSKIQNADLDSAVEKMRGELRGATQDARELQKNTEVFGPPKPLIDEKNLTSAVRKLQHEARPTLDEVARAAYRTANGIEQAGRNANGTLKNGLDEAARITQNINKNVASIRAGMIVNQAAVGLQDFAVVLEMTGSWSRALSAAANNAIQLMTLISPWAGAITAAVIAGYQLYSIFSGTAAEAKRAKQETEALTEAIKASKKAAAEQYDTGTIGTMAEADAAEKKGWQDVGRIDAQIDRLQQDRTEEMRNLGHAGNDPRFKERAAQRIKAIDEETNKLLIERAKKEAEIGDIQSRKRELAPQEADRAAYDASLKERIEADKAKQKANEEAAEKAAREDERLTQEEERKKQELEREADQRREQATREAQSIRERYETPDERAARQLAEVNRHTGTDAPGGFFGRLSEEEAARARRGIEKEREKANELLNAAANGRQTVRGTFSGAALGGLGGGGIQEKTLKANQDTAKNTREINKELRELGKRGFFR